MTMITLEEAAAATAAAALEQQGLSYARACFVVMVVGVYLGAWGV